MVTKNTTREQKAELKECPKEYHDVCVSTNVRTDWTSDTDGPEQTYLAGSWQKGCGQKGRRGLDMFGGEESDRCIELTDENTKYITIKVCNINA